MVSMKSWVGLVAVILSMPAALPTPLEREPLASSTPSEVSLSFAVAQRGYGVLDPFVNWFRGLAVSKADSAPPPRPSPTMAGEPLAQPSRTGLRRILCDLWKLLLSLFRQVGLLIPLYHRIARDRELDHDARRQFLGALRGRPGSPLSELARDLGMHPKTLLYHARRLASSGIVSLERDGKFLRAWPNPRPSAEAVLHGTKRRIVEALDANVVHTRSSLARQLGMTPQAVGLHLRCLVARGWIDAEKPGQGAQGVGYRLRS